MNRMKNLIHEVRGYIDGREDCPESLGVQAQEMLGRSGLQVVSVAALMVLLPNNITQQITDANEQTIQAQSEQGINEARAVQHIAEKLNEIKKKRVDRDEEMRDAENQVNVQRARARLAEAEEFAKRQAKRAEQKVEQALEMQALEHKMSGTPQPGTPNRWPCSKVRLRHSQGACLIGSLQGARAKAD